MNLVNRFLEVEIEFSSFSGGMISFEEFYCFERFMLIRPQSISDTADFNVTDQDIEK